MSLDQDNSDRIIFSMKKNIIIQRNFMYIEITCPYFELLNTPCYTNYINNTSFWIDGFGPKEEFKRKMSIDLLLIEFEIYYNDSKINNLNHNYGFKIYYETNISKPFSWIHY